MPLLRIPVLLPSMGMDYSRPATLINNENSFPQNMRFSKGDVAKRYGRSLFGNTAIDDGPIMGYSPFELADGTKNLLRLSTTDVEKYNVATDAWDDIADAPFTGGENDYFDFAVASESDMIIFSQGVNNLRKWTGTGNQQILGGSPGMASTMCYLSPYVLLGNLTEEGTPNPWKVKWPDTSDPENWTTGNAGSTILSNSGDPSGVKKLERLNEYAAAYKHNSLWLGRLDVSEVVAFDCVQTGVGLISKNCVVDVDGTHYFMANNNFYSWNGATLTPIGNAVLDQVFSTIKKANAAKFFALHAQNSNEVWFHVVPTGGTYPTQVWKYNYRYDIWYYDTVTNLTAGINFEDSDLVQRIIVGDSDGYSYEEDSTTYDDNAVAVSCQVDTKDFTSDKFELLRRWLQLDLWAYGVGTLSVDYSIDRGDNWTSLSSATLESTMPTKPITMFFDIVSSHIRFRFRNANSEEYFYLRKFYPYYLDRAEQWR